MGTLPKDRVLATRAFEHAGLDYFGPLHVMIGRGKEKRYGVLFSCNYTRAIHLEIARRLDTPSCLMAISRFVNRRGRSKTFRSDNGTNLVEACKEMKQDLLKMNKVLQISQMGGQYERQIRSVQKNLYGLVNRQTLTDEELETVMIKVEWIMNSRPLTTTLGEDTSVVAIMPNHLMGIRTVETDVTLATEHDQYRGWWKRVNHVTGQVWKQFHSEYVLTLQQRHKWQDQKPDLVVNDIVVVQDGSLGRAYWPMGRIIRIDPSRDVRTQNGIYTRPITKFAKLIKPEG